MAATTARNRNYIMWLAYSQARIKRRIKAEDNYELSSHSPLATSHFILSLTPLIAAVAAMFASNLRKSPKDRLN
jgi:hypothetical protein